jgi:hypothetical protein
MSNNFILILLILIIGIILFFIVKQTRKEGYYSNTPSTTLFPWDERLGWAEVERAGAAPTWWRNLRNAGQLKAQEHILSRFLDEKIDFEWTQQFGTQLEDSPKAKRLIDNQKEIIRAHFNILTLYDPTKDTTSPGRQPRDPITGNPLPYQFETNTEFSDRILNYMVRQHAIYITDKNNQEPKNGELWKAYAVLEAILYDLIEVSIIRTPTEWAVAGT